MAIPKGVMTPKTKLKTAVINLRKKPSEPTFINDLIEANEKIKPTHFLMLSAGIKKDSNMLIRKQTIKSLNSAILDKGDLFQAERLLKILKKRQGSKITLRELDPKASKALQDQGFASELIDFPSVLSHLKSKKSKQKTLSNSFGSSITIGSLKH